MRTRLIFFMIAVFTLSLSPTTAATSASVAKIQIQAITDSKPGEVEVTFLSKSSKSSKSLITSYQIVAKPVGASGLVFSKNYSKQVSGYISQKVSPLSPGVDYIFTLTQRSVDKKVTRSTPYPFTTEPTSPGAPRITSASATDSDEAVIFFDAPKDDGGTQIFSYTVTANPGQIITTSNQQVAGSITALGLTKATRYTFTITAQNLYGRSEPSLISPSVITLAQKIVRSSPASTTAAPLAAPAFTISSAAENRTVNTTATGFTSTSTGGAIASFTINTTPPGMSFNTTTGALTGRPNTVAGATTYTITATNASGSATQTFTLTVTAVVYIVGQTGPGGGKVFYVSDTAFACGPTRAASCTYLEAAPAGWMIEANARVTWAKCGASCYQETTVPGDGATATEIGWGYRNTRAIIAQGNNNSSSSAAALAVSYTVTVSGVVYDDWFLSSKDELNLLYLQQAVVGGLMADYYWSSSERNATSAWLQLFTDGVPSTTLKNNNRYVRPVRAF